MPFAIPTLPETRALSRDFLAAYLAGGADLPPNSRARVLSDGNAGLAFGAYQFIARLATEFLPDTASAEFLDRWANIFLNGRQAATFSEGSITVTGVEGTFVPVGTLLAGGGASFEVLVQTTVGDTVTPVPIRATTAGTAGNLVAGAALAFTTAIAGVDAAALVVSLSGGVDTESDASLRDRVLERIRKPPMGGDADDYVAWARAVPGVTRAWTSPGELGPGSVTLRFMMDDLRADAGGFPTADDVATVQTYMDERRPVAVQDFIVAAPVPEPIDFTITGLSSNTPGTRTNIAASVATMLREKAAPARAVNGTRVPAQTIYAAWVAEAAMAAVGVDHFDLAMSDHVMPYNGALAVLGEITYA
ncbi:baseplate J/gp47 family protein [Methylobacterium durans]|uniref:Baseplate J protein n=1 Tax=Methylobacterium durans TaxID=2202825 RepID=A0A2U8WAK0_9HYPH|nr:baseplate J/gp47 family protein [Methylobacterium durans]AWN43174.1 baseplate J protein [Methylobacterium durans]